MKRSYLKYILGLILFGSNGIIASRIELESREIVLLRTLLGSIFLVLVFLGSKQKFTFKNYKKDLFFICISGAAMGASWMFLYEAYVQIGVGTASLLYYCGPVIVMALSAVLFREKITAAKLAGFIAVLAGIFLINVHISGGNGSYGGFVYGLAAAVMYSVMIIANKKSENVKGMENSCLQLVVSFLTVTVCVGIRSGYHISLSSSGWIWMIVLGVLNTGVGCWLYFSSIGDLPVQTVAILGYIEPLSAVLFSAAVLGERMAAIQIAGVVLIIGGAVLGTALKDKKFFGKQGG